MNKAFQAVVEKEQGQYFTLGNPASDQAFYDARMIAMSLLTGGKGFRKEPAEPRRRAVDGTTRGERKRAAYKLMLAKISEQREALKEAMRVKLKCLKWKKKDIDLFVKGMPA